MSGRLFSDVAEIGLAAPSVASFERELLLTIVRTLDADGGSIHVTDALGRTTMEVVGHSRPKEYALVLAMSEVEADALVRRAVQGTVCVTPEEPEYDRLTWFHAYRRIHARSVIGRIVVANCFVLGVSLSRCRIGPFTEDDARLLDSIVPVVKMAEELQRRRQSLAHPDPDTAFGLMGREAQITELVCKGMQNPEIAHLLGISRNTVRNILTNVFRKLGATTRSELVMLCAGADALQGPPTLLEGLRRSSNPARGYIQAALGCASLDDLSPRFQHTPRSAAWPVPTAPTRAPRRSTLFRAS
jgi:DNA-binding CsgD family transcriptional regulator